jgi:hypothetical protein
VVLELLLERFESGLGDELAKLVEVLERVVLALLDDPQVLEIGPELVLPLIIGHGRLVLAAYRITE